MSVEEIREEINYHKEGIKFAKNNIININYLLKSAKGEYKRNLKDAERHAKSLIKRKQEKIIKLEKEVKCRCAKR